MLLCPWRKYSILWGHLGRGTLFECELEREAIIIHRRFVKTCILPMNYFHIMEESIIKMKENLMCSMRPRNFFDRTSVGLKAFAILKPNMLSVLFFYEDHHVIMNDEKKTFLMVKSHCITAIIISLFFF